MHVHGTGAHRFDTLQAAKPATITQEHAGSTKNEGCESLRVFLFQDLCSSIMLQTKPRKGLKVAFLCPVLANMSHVHDTTSLLTCE
jgi:hypothetical protein